MMTIANMIENGTRHVSLWCRCGHHADADVSSLNRGLHIPILKHRFTCSECGGKPYESRPAWHKRSSVAPVDMRGAAQIIVHVR